MTLTTEPDVPPEDAPASATEPTSAACNLGRFILGHLPYANTFVFPDLPEVPTYPEAATPEDKMKALEATLDAVHTDNLRVAIPGEYETDREVDISGLYPELTATQALAPNMFVTNEKLKAYDDSHDKKLLNWPMGGANHQVTKAMRIWYTYNIPDMRPDKNGNRPASPEVAPLRTVGTWLLIGYVGDGH